MLAQTLNCLSVWVYDRLAVYAGYSPPLTLCMLGEKSSSTLNRMNIWKTGFMTGLFFSDVQGWEWDEGTWHVSVIMSKMRRWRRQSGQLGRDVPAIAAWAGCSALIRSYQDESGRPGITGPTFNVREQNGARCCCSVSVPVTACTREQTRTYRPALVTVSVQKKQLELTL